MNIETSYATETRLARRKGSGGTQINTLINDH